MQRNPRSARTQSARTLICALAMTGVSADGFAAGEAPHAPGAQVHELLLQTLAGAPGKEVQMLTVEYPPGGSSASHRHHAQVFVYVISGRVRMQLQGSPVVTLGPGETFFEGLTDVHAVSANASRTEPAKFVVFMVRDRMPAH